MSEVIEISALSEAGYYLAAALAKSDTYLIRLAEYDGRSIKVKVNEGMWTYRLNTVNRDAL